MALVEGWAIGQPTAIQIGTNRRSFLRIGVLCYEMQDVFADGTAKPSTETLKFTPLPRLSELLRGAGLEVTNRYQNWRLETFREGSAAVVLELRKPL